MRPYLFLLLLATACGEKSNKLQFGATREEVQAAKGEPARVDVISPDSEVLVYEDGQKIQLDRNRVVARFSLPKDEEKILLYWKHKFKDCETKEVSLARASDGHSPREFEYGCVSQGISVLHTEGSPYIQKVLEYAPQ